LVSELQSILENFKLSDWLITPVDFNNCSQEEKSIKDKFLNIASLSDLSLSDGSEFDI